MYITSTEWANEFGGKKQKRNNGEFKRLPFDCCALTFHPFEHPVASPSGVCYELLNIIPYLKKYGTDPTTGEKLTPKGLTRLHFSKNGDGKYHCPVTFKVFNENTRITAIGTTGNVYAFDAIDSLCIKVKNWKDLLDDTPFARKDLVHIQDPTDVEKHNLTRSVSRSPRLPVSRRVARGSVSPPSPLALDTWLRGGWTGRRMCRWSLVSSSRPIACRPQGDTSTGLTWTVTRMPYRCSF